MLKDLLDRGTELRLDLRRDFRIGMRVDAVLQLCKLLSYLGRHDIDAQTRHLTELDEATLEPGRDSHEALRKSMLDLDKARGVRAPDPTVVQDDTQIDKRGTDNEI